MKKFFLAAAAACAAAAAIASSVFALTPTTIYNNIQNPLPGNVPSYGFAANALSELGDRIGFAGTLRYASSATLVMSSWGCQSGHWTTNDCVTTPGATFTHPITINLYKVGAGNAPGTLLGSVTQVFTMPYRPSADSVNCTGADAGKWYDSSSNTCFNGKAFTITFDLSSLHLVLPDSIIYGVAYNTSNYGYTPIGQATACYTTSAGCPYDSLNVGATDGPMVPSVGTNPAQDDGYANSSYAGWYCDSGAGGTGSFRLDQGCWAGYKPEIKFVATETPVGPPTSKDACKDGVWQTYTAPRKFKNQGDCIQYVNTGK
jgi:hypothetical protein